MISVLRREANGYCQEKPLSSGKSTYKVLRISHLFSNSPSKSIMSLTRVTMSILDTARGCLVKGLLKQRFIT